MLRPGNVHSADRWKELLEPIVARYEKKKIRKYFRGEELGSEVDMRNVGLYISQDYPGAGRLADALAHDVALHFCKRRLDLHKGAARRRGGVHR